MAKIKPFKAVRPEPSLVSRIAALPYDVYDRGEAAEEVHKEPLSFLHIDRPETWFDPSVDIYDARVYEKAAQVLRQWMDEGYFIREPRECFYIYEQIMDGRSQTGIVGCASVDDYVNGVIKKHENTREDKEQDRIRHIRACGAQTGPIFLAYRANASIRAVMDKYRDGAPLYDFVSEDGTAQRVWAIDGDADIQAVSAAFEAISDIYIADGHHRAASAVKVSLEMRQARAAKKAASDAALCSGGADDQDAASGGAAAADETLYPGEDAVPDFLESDYFLSVLFPDEELKIMPYHRVVRDLNGLSADEFLAAAEKHFEVRCLPDFDMTAAEGHFPAHRGSFGMYLNGQWYLLTARTEIRSEDVVDGLDVSLLQDYLLGPVLGIDDPRTDSRVDFIGGIRGLGALVDRCETGWAAAFAMYPTSIGELFAVADMHRLMPPKSTWFEPKLYSGLFIHTFDD